MKGMDFGNSPIEQNDESVTPEMIQQLDDQITKMKKLGNKGAAQVLLDKKSKLMDNLETKENKARVSVNGGSKHKSGSKNKAIYKGKVVKGWQNPYAVKPKRN